jgi:hypothetical protein
VKVIKSLAIFLLFLAIPLQGMAVANQMFCHGSGSVPTVTQKTSDHSHHQTADHHHDQSKSLDHQASKAEVAKSLNHKCSTCSHCCFGTALLPAPLILVFNQAVSPFIATNNMLSGVISPFNLERPPRLFLA